MNTIYYIQKTVKTFAKPKYKVRGSKPTLLTVFVLYTIIQMCLRLFRV